MCLHALDGSIKYLKCLKHKKEEIWCVKYDYKQEKRYDLIAVISRTLLMSLSDLLLILPRSYSKKLQVMKGSGITIFLNMALQLYTCLNWLPPFQGALLINNHLPLILASLLLFFLNCNLKEITIILPLSLNKCLVAADDQSKDFWFSGCVAVMLVVLCRWVGWNH